MAHMKAIVYSKTGGDGMGKGKECLKNGGLEMIQKILTELKMDGNNKIFLGILEKLFKTDKCSKYINFQRLDIIIMFLTMVENYSVDNYLDVFHCFDKYFISSELRKLTVKAAEIREFSILGMGDFGIVSFGKLGDSLVAVKRAKHGCVGTKLLQEAKIMAGLDHENVVKLVAFQRDPTKIVMEYVQGVTLNTAVYSHLIVGLDILKALHGVAAGMEYIAGKNIIHRDLHGNNILIDSNKVCKIGDLGLARYVGYNPKLEFKEKNPLQILFHNPPETLKSHIFTTKSDVWSFGVLVLDLYKFEETLSGTVKVKWIWESLINFERKGRKGTFGLPRPESCPLILFHYVAEEVLDIEPCRRPAFSSIRKRIGDMLPVKLK
ncbi:ephrin type-A receptor 4a-like [Anoplophora glabripennis]|uniref:ephrin type-A receptor 4a-like n=1 Tax=Anoplophora glabripennis TaxID=217634 RepID=UPI0008749250|nr:ephrin type-A receptor 4a-like [Anoplophora glabripennis]